MSRLRREKRDKKLQELIRDHSKPQKLVLLALDVIFLFVPFVLAMPVVTRWFSWLIFWTLFVLLIQIHLEFPQKTTLRVLLTLSAVLLFVGCLQSLAWAQWRGEKAAALSGTLCSFRTFWGKCYTPFPPIIEIGGDSGSKFVYAGAEDSVDMGKFARTAGLRIERGENGMEISTPVLDRSGKKIGSIEKNHWTVVSQPEIWDKNYTDNALEIKDNRGEVVLQIRFLPDRLQIAAEWRDQFGRGQEWAKCGKPPTGCVIPWSDARTESQNEVAIEPIFQYPSSEHWGEYIKK
jgi:hypothetical protein